MKPIIAVRRRGRITLPASVRSAHDIEPGDTFQLVDLDGVLVLTRRALFVPELAREIERVRLDAGLTAEELLEDLAEERRRYPAEDDGDGASPPSA